MVNRTKMLHTKGYAKCRKKLPTEKYRCCRSALLSLSLFVDYYVLIVKFTDEYETSDMPPNIGGHLNEQ